MSTMQPDLYKKLTCYFSIAFLFLIYFINSWPGLYQYDVVGYASHLLGLNPGTSLQLWESLFYNQLLYIFSSQKAIFGFAMLFQGLLGLLFFIYFIRENQKISNVSLYGITAYLIACPFVILSFFYLERDVLFALCMTAPSLLLLFHKDEKWSNLKKITILLCFVSASILRWEGVLYAIFFPIQLVLLKKINVKVFYPIFCLTILFCTVTFTFAPMHLNKKLYYSLHLTLPVAYQIHLKHQNLLDPETQEIFSKVIDPLKMGQVDSVYPRVIIKEDLKPIEVFRFHARVLRLSIMHPSMYFSCRWHYLQIGSPRYIDVLKPNYFISKNMQALAATQEKIQEARLLRDGSRWWNLNIDEIKKHTVRHFLFFGSFWFGLFLATVSLILVFFSQERRTLLIVSSPSYIQTLIFLFFAPGGNGKYVLAPLYFFSLSFPKFFCDFYDFLKVFLKKHKLRNTAFSIRWLKIILNITIVLGVFKFFVLQKEKTILDFSTDSFWCFGLTLSFAVHMVATFFLAFRWREFLPTKEVPLFELFKASWMSQFTSLLSFGGVAGDFQKILFLQQKYKYSSWDATMSCARERWWSLYGFITILGVSFLAREELVLNSFLLFVTMAFIGFSGRVFLTSVFSHLAKIVVLLYLITSDVQNLEGIFFAGTVLLSELMPWGLDGLGTSHYVAYQTFLKDGIHAYSVFYIGKVLFKCSGAIFFLKGFRL